MNWKKQFGLLGIFLWGIFSIATVNAQRILPAYWTSNLSTDAETGWSYYLGEDQIYYYVGAIIPKGKVQDQVRICGMTLWIGKKPVKKGSIGVRFPMGFTKDSIPTTPFELAYTLAGLPIPSQTQLPERKEFQILQLNGKGDTILGNIDDLVQMKLLLEAGQNESLVYQLQIDKSMIPEKTREKPQLSFTFVTGTLDRPTNLRGTDATGLNYNNPSGQVQPKDVASQARIRDFYFYSEYTIPIEIKFRTAKS